MQQEYRILSVIERTLESKIAYYRNVVKANCIVASIALLVPLYSLLNSNIATEPKENQSIEQNIGIITKNSYGEYSGNEMHVANQKHLIDFKNTKGYKIILDDVLKESKEPPSQVQITPQETTNREEKLVPVFAYNKLLGNIDNIMGSNITIPEQDLEEIQQTLQKTIDSILLEGVDWNWGDIHPYHAGGMAQVYVFPVMYPTEIDTIFTGWVKGKVQLNPKYLHPIFKLESVTQTGTVKKLFVDAVNISMSKSHFVLKDSSQIIEFPFQCYFRYGPPELMVYLDGNPVSSAKNFEVYPLKFNSK